MVLAGLGLVGENHDSQNTNQTESPADTNQDAQNTDQLESPVDTNQDTLNSDQIESQVDETQSHPDSALEILEPDLVPSDTAADTSTTQSDDERLLTLFTRLQSLEREYSILHGRLEELEHLYQEERHMNRRRFLDMDRRLREQFGSQLAPEDALTSEDVNSEVGMYRRGMAFIDADDYVQATGLFQQIVDTFPNGERVPDAMYWLAEIHRNVEPKDLEKSRQFFVQMVTLYSEHARIPEALAKLGMVYHELGNVTRALEYLDRVVAEYPDHDAARLAETYAQELR